MLISQSLSIVIALLHADTCIKCTHTGKLLKNVNIQYIRYFATLNNATKVFKLL